MSWYSGWYNECAYFPYRFVMPFVISAWMCCCLHLSSTCSHVTAYVSSQIGHVLDGKASLPKKSCFGAWPIYCPVWNFIKHVFCLFVMAGFIQKSFDSILSMSSFSSHLCNWRVRFAIIVKLCSLSCLRMCLLRCLMGPLSGYSCMECTNLFVGSIM